MAYKLKQRLLHASWDACNGRMSHYNSDCNLRRLTSSRKWPYKTIPNKPRVTWAQGSLYRTLDDLGSYQNFAILHWQPLMGEGWILARNCVFPKHSTLCQRYCIAQPHQRCSHWPLYLYYLDSSIPIATKFSNPKLEKSQSAKVLAMA